VRQDFSLAKKQQLSPALLLLVHRDSVGGCAPAAASGSKQPRRFRLDPRRLTACSGPLTVKIVEIWLARTRRTCCG
jgi:hypothetical protein